MSIKQRTPFRQLGNAYGALLGMNQTLSTLPDNMSKLDAGLSQLAREVAALKPERPAPRACKLDIHEAMGFRLLLDNTSFVDQTIIGSGTWEPEQLAYTDWLTRRLHGKSSPIFLDIGSYFGLYSLLAHRSGVFDRIHAFEPDRQNFAQLQANMLLNQTAQAIQCFNKAVSYNDDDLFIWDSATHPDGNRAGVCILPEEHALPHHRTEAVSVDSVVRGSGHYILMKIDVEGYEASVLRGMTKTVANNRVVMQVEIMDVNKEPALMEIDHLGLRRFHSIYPDFYYTNMSESELGV